MSDPFFSIVTVVRNDAWSLFKTARSVFKQAFRDYEYLVVDGDSTDFTQSLVKFWQAQGLVSRAISEPDTSVYNAMNKGLGMARGKFVCFLNAGDIFASDRVLDDAHRLLQDGSKDGILGWGELNGQIWSSWVENEVFKMASLGFCHQSLYVKRELLLSEPFDERPFKTDSDTLQLGRLYERGAKIAILPEVLAIRGGEPGLSADLERTRRSIQDTLTREYSSITPADAEAIIDFRRACKDPRLILDLMAGADRRLAGHLSYMVLDTLFQRPSLQLGESDAEALLDKALQTVAAQDAEAGQTDVRRLISAQTHRADLLSRRKGAGDELDGEIKTFETEEESRLQRIRETLIVGNRAKTADVAVSLTSFPARLKTVHLAIRSLVEQTQPPREIHLWLGRNEVPNRSWLPRKLLELEQHGLQIQFVERTFHQYDKFLHCAALNAELPLVVVDDDVIYPPYCIEQLMKEHRNHPGAVIGNRCHLMEADKNGVLLPYQDWKREQRLDKPSLRLFPTGAGGVLYPIGFLNSPMVTDVDAILSHAPYADDIWLKACALARAVPTMATALSRGADWYHRYTPTMRAGTLMDTNVERGLNDIQMARCVEWLSRTRPAWRSEFLTDSRAE